MDIHENNDRTIKIQGQHHRYQIKKATKSKKHVSTREVPNDFLNHSTQRDMIELMYLNGDVKGDVKDEDLSLCHMIEKELKIKLRNYTQQDKKSKRYDDAFFIQYEEVLGKLVESKLKCYYCKGSVFMIYSKSHDDCQWTLERLNNNLGHNASNIVISCLGCNLGRRTMNSDAYRFTKQLQIVKSNKED